MLSIAIEGGFIRLHRQIIMSDIWDETPAVRCVAITLLTLAEWRPQGRTAVHPFLGCEVTVNRGHILISHQQLAHAARVGTNTAGRAITRLVDLEFLERTGTPCLYRLPKFDFFNPLSWGSGSQDKPPRTADDRGGVPNFGGGGSTKIGEGGPPKLGRGVPKNGGPIYKDEEYRRIQKKVKKGADKPPAPETTGDMANKKTKPLKLTPPPDKPPRVPKVEIDRVLQAHTDAVLQATGLVVYHSGTDHKQARSLVLKFGVDKAVELATAFPAIDDGWLHDKGYPLAMLDRNVNAVEMHLQGKRKRKKRDPLDICTDPNDPGWDEDL